MIQQSLFNCITIKKNLKNKLTLLWWITYFQQVSSLCFSYYTDQKVEHIIQKHIKASLNLKTNGLFW